MHKNVTQAVILASICPELFVVYGFAADPTGGAYSALPDPLAVFKGPTSKERGKGKGREEEWNGEEEEEGEGKKGKG